MRSFSIELKYAFQIEVIRVSHYYVSTYGIILLFQFITKFIHNIRKFVFPEFCKTWINFLINYELSLRNSILDLFNLNNWHRETFSILKVCIFNNQINLFAKSINDF